MKVATISWQRRLPKYGYDNWVGFYMEKNGPLIAQSYRFFMMAELVFCHSKWCGVTVNGISLLSAPEPLVQMTSNSMHLP